MEEKFERLIFLRPKNTVPFSISTNKEEYLPGDQVNISVQLDNSTLAANDPDEKFFASLIVTDVSSFLEVPKHKLTPSLPSMVYLEKEVKQMNGEIDEFQYSSEYIDPFFDVSQDGESKFTDG